MQRLERKESLHGVSLVFMGNRGVKRKRRPGKPCVI
uniref:Uncharacterized protein n=1 Tax=Arundo donax TaxID=35708 RepID=A0A0A9B1J9_ARUDO